MGCVNNSRGAVSTNHILTILGIIATIYFGLAFAFDWPPFGAEPAPVFSVENLSVEPLEVEPEETVIISMLVANKGGRKGNYDVVLRINGMKEAVNSVTLAAGDNRSVSFSVSKKETGSYIVDVNGLSGGFTVVAPPNQPPQIHDLDFVYRKFIGVGDIARVMVKATDPDDDDIAYIWDATRGYIPEEGLTTWKWEVDYWAPDSAGLDAISVNATDVHDSTNTKVKQFWVYDQETAEEARSHLSRAGFLAEINEYQGSVEQLTKLADIVPEFHEVYLLRGQAYTELEDYPQAIDNYRMYIELEPTDVDAYLLRAKANLLWGYRDTALLDIESYYSLAESMEPWRIELLEPYETLRTDQERLMWMDEAVSPGALLSGL